MRGQRSHMLTLLRCMRHSIALSLHVRTFAGTWRKDRNLIHHTQLILDRYALPGFAWLQWLAHNAL